MSDPFPPDTKRCPFCAEEIQVEAVKCRHCGEWLVPPPRGRGPAADGRRYSDARPLWLVALLSVTTFGIYNLRWFYRTWKQLEKDRGLEMKPGLHTLGLLVPILNIAIALGFFREIKEYAEETGGRVGWSAGLLVTVNAVSTLLWRFSSPVGWIVALVVPAAVLVLVQATLNRYWATRQPGYAMKRGMTGGQVAAAATGSLFLALAGVGVVMQRTRTEDDLVSRARLSAAPAFPSPAGAAASSRFSEELAEGQRAAARRLPGSQLSAQDLFRVVSPSLFVVTTRDSQGAIRTLGSAVAIAGNVAVTNAHVVEDGGSIRVTQGEESWSASVLDRDPNRDLCRLRIEGLDASVALVRDSESLRIGQRVYAVGAPGGLEMTLSEGLISGFRDYRGQRVVQTSAPISRGSSGGGLFDEIGALVGITTFMIAGGQNLNFAILADSALLPGIRPLSADELLGIWRDRRVPLPAGADPSVVRD